MEKRKKIILGKATKNKKIKPIETPVQNGYFNLYPIRPFSICKYTQINFFNVKYVHIYCYIVDFHKNNKTIIS